MMEFDADASAGEESWKNANDVHCSKDRAYHKIFEG
jgi:hypothetical protein